MKQVAVLAEKYGMKDSGGVVGLCRTVVYGGVESAGMLLRAIDVSAGRAEESRCTDTEECTTGFYRFLFEL